VARLKLARLLESEGTLSNDEVVRPETFEEAAVRIVAGQQAEGLTTWTDRLQRLRQFVFPELGQLPVGDVRPAHVRAALARGLASGKARSTIAKIKIDISTVLAELWRDEAVPANVAKRVQIPKNAPDWDSHGRPVTGPVFPRRRGASGPAKGHLVRLRAPGRAVNRPPFARCLASGGQQPTRSVEKHCLIQSGSSQRRPLDFHFPTGQQHGLADANVNVQTAMRLAGHRNASTPMRYVRRTGRHAKPTAASPSPAK
jgi:hypothetical protein